MEPAEKKQEIISQALFHRDLLINFTKFVIFAGKNIENLNMCDLVYFFYSDL